MYHGDREISYAGLIAAADGYARLLQIAPGDRAAVFAENRPEWLYAFFAVWRRGGIAVPVDYLSPADEVGFILNDCRPAVVFCSENTREVLNAAIARLAGGYRPELLVLDSLRPPASSAPLPEVTRGPHDTAVIIYTSGTTGSPKGVMLSHDNLLANIEAVTDKVPIFTKEDRLLAILPFHHSFPLQGTIMAPFYVGATIALLERVSSTDILQAMVKHRITIIIGVPRLYRLFHKGLIDKINASAAARLLLKVSRAINNLAFGRLVFRKAQQAFGGHIKYFVSGGAKLDEQVGSDLAAMGFEVLEGYGMTEAAPMITFTRPGQVKIGTAGTAVPGTTVEIREGEIVAAGRNIMQGYWHKPGDTAAILRDGWLHSGDQGFLDARGRLHVTGRTKEIIVLSNGKNINPEEIENRILSLSSLIKEIGIYHKDERLGAVIHPDPTAVKEHHVVNLRETIKWLVLDKFNLTVPHHKKVLHFTLVDHELPKTRLGKLKRFLLPSLAAHALVMHDDRPEPDTAEYRMLRDYLESALDAQVHPDQHLEYDVGLDSLAKIELDSFLEKVFGVPLPEDDPASHYTIGQLSEVIAKLKTKSEGENADWHSILREQIDYRPPTSIYMMRLMRFLTAPLFTLYFRLRGTGVDRLPKSPFILAPNHQSFYDGVFLSILLPDRVLRDTYFMAAGKHVRTPFTRFNARHSNLLVMDINRDLKGTLQRAAVLLRAGKNLVIFPEGARSRDGKLNQFKRTFAILAKELNVPVVPVAVSGAYAAFPIDRKIPKHGKIRLTFLPPIHPGKMDYSQIAEMTQHAIAAKI